MFKFVLGVDIGGSHITCQIFDLEEHKLVAGTRTRFDVDCHAASEDILDAWVSAIRSATESYTLSDFSGIGFAMPGPFDYFNGIALFKEVEKFDSLFGIDIRSELRQRLFLPESFRIRFLNDAASFAIGESYMGEAAHLERFLAITLGTGFGTTFIHQHIPVAGMDGIPEDGFLYHLPFNDSNADNHFSTRWFIRQYLLQTGIAPHGVRELAERAQEDQVAGALFHTFGSYLGLFLAPFLKRFMADGLVIGGNISSAWHLFKPAFMEELMKADLRIQVIVSGLQEDAALAGAASLCDDALYAQLVAPIHVGVNVL